MSDERRNQRRVPLLIEVLWEGSSGKQEARTSDLSEGGCFVDTFAHAASDETLKLRLRLPGGDWIDVEGRVSYTFPNTGFGIRFTNVSESDRKKLTLLIKAQASREDKD